MPDTKSDLEVKYISKRLQPLTSITSHDSIESLDYYIDLLILSFKKYGEGGYNKENIKELIGMTSSEAYFIKYLNSWNNDFNSATLKIFKDALNNADNNRFLGTRVKHFILTITRAGASKKLTIKIIKVLPTKIMPIFGKYAEEVNRKK